MVIGGVGLSSCIANSACRFNEGLEDSEIKRQGKRLGETESKYGKLYTGYRCRLKARNTRVHGHLWRAASDPPITDRMENRASPVWRLGAARRGRHLFRRHEFRVIFTVKTLCYVMELYKV